MTPAELASIKFELDHHGEDAARRLWDHIDRLDIPLAALVGALRENMEGWLFEAKDGDRIACWPPNRRGSSNASQAVIMDFGFCDIRVCGDHFTARPYRCGLPLRNVYAAVA